MQTMRIDIGMAQNERHEIAQGLSKLLADTYTLYLKTHNFHWNVTGPMFRTLQEKSDDTTSRSTIVRANR